MKRLHVNLSTDDLDRSVEFYVGLFGQEPSLKKSDYAKWMLDDPRVNFTLSTHGSENGIDHLGIQAEDENEFSQMRARLHDSENEVFDQTDVSCCYANSSKVWVRDPNGVAWETFLTHGGSVVYGDGSRERAVPGADGEDDVEKCCAPNSTTASSCCV